MTGENSVLDASVFGIEEGDIPTFLDRRHELAELRAAGHDPHAHGDEDNHDATGETGGDAPGAHEGQEMDGVDHAAAEHVAAGGNAVAGDDLDTEWDAAPPHDDGGVVGSSVPGFAGALDPQAAAQFEASDHSPAAGLEVVSEIPSADGTVTASHNQPPPEPLSREQMLKEFNRDVASYGRDSGKGAAALPRLGLRVIRAAYDGLISTEKPKSGEKSDAVRIYEAYAQNDSKHAEHTKGGMKANAAKLNALIGLGCMTTVDGVEVAQRAVDIREKLESSGGKPKALFAGLVDVARAQLGQDSPLSDAAIEQALGKVEKEKTLAGEWESILKKVEGLISGENNSNLKDTSDRAELIYGQIKEHVNTFATNKERDDKVAWLMERGMTRAQAEEFASK